MAFPQDLSHPDNMLFGPKNGISFVSRLRKKLSRHREEPSSDTAVQAPGSGTDFRKPGKGPRNAVSVRPGQFTRKGSEQRDKLKTNQLTPEERRSRRSWNPRNTSASLQIVPSRSLGNLNEEDDRRRSYADPKSLIQAQVPESPISPSSADSRLSPQRITEPASPLQFQQQQDLQHQQQLQQQQQQEQQQQVPKEQQQESVGISSLTSVTPHDPPLVQHLPELQRPAQDVDMEWRWILNLSMHFRDHSDREKFFVTYAETPKIRRRITVSCDYRNAQPGSLERELSMLRFQREKSAKIYEAIKESLPDIQFYDTITNLKLQTSEGRLHVHVTEDHHEIINFPSVQAIAHLDCPQISEKDLDFESHLSGFVYKVKHGQQVYIKKEIPGPDTIDEFLYEINALNALNTSDHVIRFGGCVVDDQRERVKGLLIAFASRGALIDIVYNDRGQLPWSLRERWAKQIVAGLSDIHEAGYVQGDFTLSNIVVDDRDNAKIIDINRRGCPVGWEPPEITGMIEGLQRIGMYIGVKSDIFQLGMCLWGIAHENDEPEMESKPLTMDHAPPDVPQWFRDITKACLSARPQDRPSAKELLARFPTDGLTSQYGPDPLSPTIIEAVAPDDDDSPLSDESRSGYMQINGLTHAIPVPPVGEAPTCCISSPDGEGLERFEEVIESSASIKSEAYLPLDEIADEIASDIESDNGKGKSRPPSRPVSRGSPFANLDMTNLSLSPQLNGRSKGSGNSGPSRGGSQVGSGHGVRQSHHIDSGYGDMEGHSRPRQLLHPHTAIKT